MRKGLVATLAVAVACAALVIGEKERAIEASDHQEPPALADNPKADIADLFAWIDRSYLALVMTVERNAAPGAGFSEAVQYVFHVNRQSAAGGDGRNTDIICVFDSKGNTAIRCWVRTEEDTIPVEGDPSDAANPLEESGIRVFAGLRNDPFFFNQAGFIATAEAVRDAAAGLSFDEDGCPNLGDGTGQALLSCLATQCDRGPGGDNAAAVDNFAGQNVLALAIAVPLDLIDGTGHSISVWASTHAVP